MRAGVEVIGEVGYAAASCRLIAARAGVSVAALYHHFPSKHALLREFLDGAWDETLSDINETIRRHGGDPPAMLDAFVRTILERQLDSRFSRLASNAALYEFERMPDRFTTELRAKRARLYAILEGLLEQGVSDGYFSLHDAGTVARASLAVVFDLAASMPETDASVGDVVRRAQALCRLLAEASRSEGTGRLVAAWHQ